MDNTAPNAPTSPSPEGGTTSALNNIWMQDGNCYAPGSTSNNVRKLPPAIYRFVQTDKGWYLERTASKYIFPYKIYGVDDDILARVRDAWHGLNSNLGIMLNGLKGTGKTIAAQQIANWAIGEGLLVINAASPVPLAAIMERIEQPMMVLFDEFEKTHDEGLYPGAQQHLLGAIDGLSRNEFRRLFVFTMNSMSVNENFIDRPSRIRYAWQFERVGTKLIEMLLADLLDPRLSHLKPEIMAYLSTREILTIDVVKTVIIECNVFKQGPNAFKKFMNISEKSDVAFRVYVVDDDGDTSELSPYFRSSHSGWIQSMLCEAGQQSFINSYVQQKKTQTIANFSGQKIEFLGPTDEENEWLCHVQVPVYKTWIDTHQSLRFQFDTHLWLDEKPSNWETPSWASKIGTAEKLTKNEERDYELFKSCRSVHGTSNRKKLRLRFVVETGSYQYDPRSIMSGGDY